MKLPITKSKSGLILWSLTAVMIVLIIFSIIIRRKEPVISQPPERAYAVEILTLSAQDRPDVVILPGRIEPMLRARLPVDKPGRVIALHVDRGDAVTNGQILLHLDARLWEAALAAAEIELAEAEREYKRWADLDRAGAVSSSDMDNIRMRLDRARIARTEALTHISQCEVRSPADGVINERYVERGEHATEGMAVFELVVTDPVKILLDVPERDAAPLAEQSELTFQVSVLPDFVFTGRVTFAAAAAQPVNNAFRMDVQAANPGGRLKPGMIAEVHYRRGTLANALAIPLDAIIPRRGEHFVFIAENDRAVRRLVRIDRITNANAIISEGLAAGDQIIVRGNRALTDGALLSITAPAEGATPP